MSRPVLASILRTTDYQRKSKLGVLAIVKGDESDYCAWYWDHASVRYRLEQLTGQRTWIEQRDTYRRLACLYRRWRQFCHYVNEIKPEWQDTGKVIAWADNSSDAVQVDKDGNTRNVQLSPPSGDCC